MRLKLSLWPRLGLFLRGGINVTTRTQSSWSPSGGCFCFLLFVFLVFHPPVLRLCMSMLNARFKKVNTRMLGCWNLSLSVSVWVSLRLTAVELLRLLRPHCSQLSLVALLLPWDLGQTEEIFQEWASLSFYLACAKAVADYRFQWGWVHLYKNAVKQIIVRQIPFKISSEFPTHLPVDVVLKADGVRRGTIDWQLQNKTWVVEK